PFGSVVQKDGESPAAVASAWTRACGQFGLRHQRTVDNFWCGHARGRGRVHGEIAAIPKSDPEYAGSDASNSDLAGTRGPGQLPSRDSRAKEFDLVFTLLSSIHRT